jgi:hypothetical protein
MCVIALTRLTDVKLLSDTAYALLLPLSLITPPPPLASVTMNSLPPSAVSTLVNLLQSTSSTVDELILRSTMNAKSTTNPKTLRSQSDDRRDMILTLPALRTLDLTITPRFTHVFPVINAPNLSTLITSCSALTLSQILTYTNQLITLRWYNQQYTPHDPNPTVALTALAKVPYQSRLQTLYVTRSSINEFISILDRCTLSLTSLTWKPSAMKIVETASPSSFINLLNNMKRLRQFLLFNQSNDIIWTDQKVSAKKDTHTIPNNNKVNPKAEDGKKKNTKSPKNNDINSSSIPTTSPSHTNVNNNSVNDNNNNGSNIWSWLLPRLPSSLTTVGPLVDMNDIQMSILTLPHLRHLYIGSFDDDDHDNDERVSMITDYVTRVCGPNDVVLHLNE